MIKTPDYVDKLTPYEAYAQGFHDGMIQQEVLEEAKRKIGKHIATFQFSNSNQGDDKL